MEKKVYVKMAEKFQTVANSMNEIYEYMKLVNDPELVISFNKVSKDLSSFEKSLVKKYEGAL
jgi:hypothetical protein